MYNKSIFIGHTEHTLLKMNFKNFQRHKHTNPFGLFTLRLYIKYAYMFNKLTGIQKYFAITKHQCNQILKTKSYCYIIK